MNVFGVSLMRFTSHPTLKPAGTTSGCGANSNSGSPVFHISSAEANNIFLGRFSERQGLRLRIPWLLSITSGATDDCEGSYGTVHSVLPALSVRPI